MSCTTAARRVERVPTFDLLTFAFCTFSNRTSVSGFSRTDAGPPEGGRYGGQGSYSSRKADAIGRRAARMAGNKPPTNPIISA